jgi:hypothetical protein
MKAIPGSLLRRSSGSLDEIRSDRTVGNYLQSASPAQGF